MIELDSREGHVLVVGSAGVDVKGRPESDPIPGSSVAGRIRSSVGGVARNIAENLARLEVPTVLLSAVGDDEAGRRVLDCCRQAGVDVSQTLVVPGERTGHYLALLTPEGHLNVAISDYAITRRVDSAYLERHEAFFAGAALVVIDAGLGDRALRTLFKLARRHKVLVCADPTSPALAGRLCRYLGRIYLITPNIAEAAALCDGEFSIFEKDRESGLLAAQMLLERGVKIAVVTLGVNGLVYASGSDRGHLPAIHTEIVDETGAGDALTSAVIFGLLHAMPLDEALRLGVSAASLTLHSRETVVPELSQDLLYDQLVI